LEKEMRFIHPRLRLLGLLLLWSGPSPGGLASTLEEASAQERVYEIADFSARLELRPDGSYHVREDITYDFQVGSFTFATRDIPLSNTDGVLNVSVQSPDLSIREVRQEEDGDSWHVHWQFREATGPITFTIEYDLLGAVREVGEQNEIFWRVVGEGWDVAFRRVTADVVIPGTLAVPISDIAVDPAEIATVALEGDAAVARFAVPGRLSPGRAYQVRVSFPKVMQGRPVGLARPENQALLAGLLGFILFLGAGGIVAYRRGGIRLPPRRHGDPGVGIPAASVLLHRKSPSWDRAFPAILFDLANRGVVTLERVDRKGRIFTQQKVALGIQGDSREPLTDFEHALLHRLAEHSQDLKEFASKGRKFRKAAMEAIREGLVAEGLLADGRARARRAMLLGLLGLLATAAVFLAGAVTGRLWVMALAGPVLGSALGLLILGDVRFPVTRAGAEERARLRGYLEGLREELLQKLKMSPIEAAEFMFSALPWLTLDPKFHGAETRKIARRLKKESGVLQAPAWVVDRTRQFEKAAAGKSIAFAAFLPFTNVTGAVAGAVAPSAAGGAGGAGGGGAAGGGGGGAG
jgi:uncharacterized protein (TIGR04222 family)